MPAATRTVVMVWEGEGGCVRVVQHVQQRKEVRQRAQERQGWWAEKRAPATARPPPPPSRSHHEEIRRACRRCRSPPAPRLRVVVDMFISHAAKLCT